ncbi:MAG: hypothetical protein ACK4V2_06740 [Pseudomonadota bacterium]|jgi:hypothetical protein|nr:hypothetical protein [Alphaproteobacteria bacterium]
MKNFGKIALSLLTTSIIATLEASSFVVLSDGLYETESRVKVTALEGYTFSEVSLYFDGVTSLPSGSNIADNGLVVLPTDYYLGSKNIKDAEDGNVCDIPAVFSRIGGIGGSLQIPGFDLLPSGSSVEMSTGKINLPTGWSFDQKNFYENGGVTDRSLASGFLNPSSILSVLVKNADNSSFSLGDVMSL